MKEISGVDDPANEIPGWMVAKAADDTSIVGKIRKALSTTGKEDIDMTQDELNAELDARFATLAEGLVEAVSKAVAAALPSVEAPVAATTEVTAPVEAAPVDAPAGITEETIAKAIETGIETAITPVLDVIDKALDRIVAIETGTVIRKSLDGQEGGDDGAAPQAPTLSDAIGAVLKGAKVTLT
jgi:hypothetical protein